MKPARQNLLLVVGLCLMVMGAFPVEAAEDHPEWFRCIQNSDCVVVGDGCAVYAANSDFAAKADTYYKDMATKMECEQSQDKTMLRATCITRKIPCKKFFGMINDPASTCADKVCAVAPLTEQ
ncbi:MAG: hypothetical protein PHX61_08575 [Alphaproteobacteria bacterium]|nr:hypothetical protein [Alphaproteobacteria bacterium]